MKHCINCGTEIEDEALVCPECNTVIVPDTETAREATEEFVPEAEDSTPKEEEASTGEVPEEEEAEDGETPEEAEDEDGETPEEAEDEDGKTPEDEETISAPRKNRWTWVTTVILVVTVLIVLALSAFLLYKNGILTKWYDDIRPKTKSVCTMEDYSEIQVLHSAVEVSDATIDGYLASVIGTDITDDAVKAYSATHSDCDATTVEEMKEYAHDYVYRYYLYNEMMNYLKGITTVKSYDEETEAALIEYSEEELQYYASSYGMDVDTIASYYGYENALAYETETAHDYMTTTMILDKIMKDKGISYTDEELNADLETFLDENGYTQYYTVDAFLEEAGDTWVYLYENLTYKFNKVMESLESNVVFIDEPAE